MSYKYRIFSVSFSVVVLVSSALYGAHWKTRAGISENLEYDSNLFNLSESKEQRFKDDTVEDQANGLFDDIRSIFDFMSVTSADIMVRGRVFSKEKLELNMGYGYKCYLMNFAKTHGKLDASLKQAIPRGSIVLVYKLVPEQYMKNYFADAVAEEDTLKVYRENRIYKPGNRSKWGFSADYYPVLLKRKETGFVKVTGIIGIGLSETEYDDEVFQGRNDESNSLSFGADLDFRKGWGLGFKYSTTDSECPTVKEVMLLDEPVYNEDFNNDGIMKNNVRRIEGVDRSTSGNKISVSCNIPLAKRVGIGVSISRNTIDYLSDEEYDTYNGKEIVKDSLGISVKSRIAKKIYMVLSYENSVKNQSYEGIAGTVMKYRKNIMGVSIITRLW